MDKPERKICPKCNLDHNYPGGTLEAITILACVMPEHKFISSQFGEVVFVDDKIPFKEKKEKK